MNRFTRRDTLKVGAGALGASLLGSSALRAQIPVADVAPPDLPIEDGATLRVSRPSKFVAPDEVFFLENTQKFTDATGVEVRVDSESWEDLGPKIGVAANTGSGPDVFVAFSETPHLYPGKTILLDDIADYLGAKYGGWWPLAQKYGTDADGNWIAMPLGASGGRLVYRKSWVGEVGYDEIPGDPDGFLDLATKLNAAGHPMGLALGNAVGDGNAWCTWLVWAFGGKMVDENDNVVINSPETIEALKYGKALYEQFIPGTLSWLDPSNNKAYLSGQLSMTQNGISIYYAAKTSDDPAIQAIAEDTYHARMPIGPVGMPTERALVVNWMAFDYTPYPNAAKAYMTFMMEEPQYGPWLDACIGYWNHPLKAYDDAAVWTADPKHEAYKHVMADSLWDGYAGSLGDASAAVVADFVMVNMVANACSGQLTPEEAAADAQRRAERYYKS